MAKGDIIYSEVDGWLIEGGASHFGIGGTDDLPLSQSPDPFHQALWAILKQLPIPDGTSDENIWAIFDAAVTGAEGAMGKPTFWDRLSPQVAWRDLDSTFTDADGNPDPIKKQNYIQEVYATAKVQGLLKEEAQPRTGANEEVVRGEDYGGPPGSLFLRDENGNLTPYTPPDKPGEAGLVEIGGNLFIQQPNGSLTAYTAPKGPGQPSFEDEFNRLIFSGQEEKATALWNLRKRITEGDGRMTRAQAMSFLTGNDLFKAEEIPALLQALMGPEPTFQDAARLSGAINVGGFTGPTPPPRPFPAFPDTLGTGAVPGGIGPAVPAAFGPTASPDAVLQNYQAFQGAAEGQGQSFTQAIQDDLAAVTSAQRTQVQAAAQQVSAARAPITNVEDFDPSFAAASPEVQEKILAEFHRQQAAGAFQTGPAAAAGSFQEAVSMADALRQAQGGDIAGARASAQGLTAQGLEGRSAPLTSFQAAYEAQGGAAREGPFQVPAGMNPWDAAVFLSQTPKGKAAMAQVNAVTPEAREAMAAESRRINSMSANTAQGPKPMTFAEAIAQVNQRRRQQQLLRQPQGRALFV